MGCRYFLAIAIDNLGLTCSKLQNFAKSLLDVADNLGRASSVVKESFSKMDTSQDSVGAVPLLKTLLEGVEMTEKQLAEVINSFVLSSCLCSGKF